MAGCRAWQEQGLAEPDVVRAAVEDYRADQDVLGAYLADRCELRADAVVSAAALYADYVLWCEAAHERAVPQRSFGSALSDRGLRRERRGKAKTRCWVGVGLVGDDVP